MHRFSQVLLLGLLMGAAPDVAFSQNKKKDDPEELQRQRDAQKRFEEAEKLYNIGDFTRALEGYKDAYLLSNNPDLLFNMGQCYRKLEQYQEALTTYRSYLREVPDSPVKTDVEARIAEVEKRLATQQFSKLVIASSPAGAEVRKGGASSRVLGVTPFTFDQLPPGEYHFTLTLPGYRPYDFDLIAEGGKEYLIPEIKLASTAEVKPAWAYRLSVALVGASGNDVDGAPAFQYVTAATLASLERFNPSETKSYGVNIAAGAGGGVGGFLMIGGMVSRWKPLKRPLWSLGYSASVGLIGIDPGPGVYARGQVRLLREGEYRGALYLRPIEVGVSLGGDYKSLDLGLLGLGYAWGLRKKK